MPSTAKTRAYFKHKNENRLCRDSSPTHLDHAARPTFTPKAMAEYRAAWQEIGEAINPHRKDIRGIGDDAQRPRALGNESANAMVEFQHLPMSSEEYEKRSAGVSSAIWIFDATTEAFWSYGFATESIWFCSDRFRASYKTDGHRRVLLHCADGNLYQAACDDAVEVELDGERKCVRILKQIDADARGVMDAFFGGAWPLRLWDGAPEFFPAQQTGSPIRVLSEAGRREIDSCHRTYLRQFPTRLRTFVSAPPGAGKTTSIIKMIASWKKRALVITFNKATQETMQQRLRAAGIVNAHARTVDSLCHEACTSSASAPDLMKWSDWELCSKFWPRSAKTKFGKTGGGRRSSNIIDFRFRHPLADAAICKQHKRLTVKGSDWDASFSSYPMQTIVEHNMTHSACRYNCDVDGSLRDKLDSYDVILVDEMQDLMSAQEQRLLFQTRRPVVLVGDSMQAINNFRDDPPCTSCRLSQEDVPALPSPIEWYGTWRLDPFTVRFIEERFERRMCSYRPTNETAEVHWKDELVHRNTLLMCRSNKHIIEAALRFEEMFVVGGEALSQRLVAAAKDTAMVTPMAKYAHNLKTSGHLERVCEMLSSRSVRLADVKNMAAVTTVHQAKGFEYDHCAVHSDLLSPENEDERNISFVAFTRHKKSLVVMQEVPPCQPPSVKTDEDDDGLKKTTSKYFS